MTIDTPSHPAAPGPGVDEQPPATAEVVIEVPKGTCTKYTAAGDVDFVSPLPTLFNYGSVTGTRAADGDPVDAVVLGARLQRGARVRHPVLAVVHFIDAGVLDLKWVVGQPPLRRRDRLTLRVFFRVYAGAKVVLNRVRGKPQPTRYDGLRLL